MDDFEKEAKRYLASLGEPPLPEQLWQRVDGARRRRMRGRMGAAVACAAVAVLAIALVLPGGLAPGVDGEPQLADAAGGTAERPVPVDEADRVRTVQAIDRALQAAYDRNATDDELAPLWQARRALVHAAPAPAANQG